MKVGILTNIAASSRGDVEPYVALAKGLKARGHEVVLVCEHKYVGFVSEHGVECEGCVGPELPSDKFPGALRRLRRFIARNFLSQAEAARSAFSDVDGVISSESLFSFEVGQSLAESLGCSFLPAFYSPLGSTSTFACPFLVPPIKNNRFANRLSHRLAARLVRRLTRRPLNVARRSILGLPEKDRSAPGVLGMIDAGLPVLYGFSPALLPKPNDWHESAHVVGYWMLYPNDGWQASRDLERFVEDGDPPVAIALGRGNEFGIKRVGAGRYWSEVQQALAQADLRGVVITAGYPVPSGEGKTDRAFFVRSVPYSWLFSRTSAVVHHCGAGTTGAVLRSGVPSVAIPAAFDQSFWAAQLEGAGLSTRALPMRRFSASRLARLLRQAVDEPRFAQSAKAIAAAMSSEDGVSEGARLAEEYLQVGGVETRRSGKDVPKACLGDG